MASAERQEGWSQRSPLQDVTLGLNGVNGFGSANGATISLGLIEAELKVLDPTVIASVDFDVSGHDDAVYADC